MFGFFNCLFCVETNVFVQRKKYLKFFKQTKNHSINVITLSSFFSFLDSKMSDSEISSSSSSSQSMETFINGNFDTNWIEILAKIRKNDISLGTTFDCMFVSFLLKKIDYFKI